MPTETPRRHALNGPTMGTRYSAVFFSAQRNDADHIVTALQAAVDEVDEQMSTWKPDSDLMQFNDAPVGEWMTLPAELLTVIATGLDVGRGSNGAFDIGTGDLVQAWGFGPPSAPAGTPVTGSSPPARRPAHDVLEFDQTGRRLRKRSPISIDLSGIAKGYGVDRLAETLERLGITDYLVAIDGEVRAHGRKPDGERWRIAVERPLEGRREIAGYVDLEDGALATSGSYRHTRERDGKTYSHTMDPRTGRPVENDFGAVTVRASSCMLADAWATALLVTGPDRGQQLAAANGLEAMFQPA